MRGFENTELYRQCACDAVELDHVARAASCRLMRRITEKSSRPGEYWIDVVKKDEHFRIVDVEGNQAADTLLFSAADPADRYSFVDTLRAQRNVYLSLGSKLLSTAGNTLAEIVADTVGRHDTLGGACASESNTVRYALDKRTMHACRDSYLLALAEHDHFGTEQARSDS